MTLSKRMNVQWFLRYQTQPANAGEVSEAAQVVPNVRWSLHQVCSSVPCSYSFTSTNGSLWRLRRCRLCGLCRALGPFTGCKLVCSATWGHGRTARGLGAELPRAAPGRSCWLKQMTHWNDPSWFLKDFRPSCFYLLVCLFIRGFKRGRCFSAREKQDQEQLEMMLASTGCFPHPAKAPQALLTIILFLSCAPPEQCMKIAPLCWFVVVVF